MASTVAQAIDQTSLLLQSEGGEGGEGGEEPELVEESGPVQYSEEDALDDEDIEQLAYDGDPLLHSDCEDEGTYIPLSLSGCDASNCRGRLL